MRMSVSIVAAGLCALILAAGAKAQPPAKPAGPVFAEVVVTGLEAGRGDVYVQVCDSTQFMKGACAYSAKGPAKAKSQTFRIGPMAAGNYAVSVWYDRNGNGRMERNQWGAPTEPTGASRGAVGRRGPPAFDDAVMAFTAPRTKVAVKVRTSGGLLDMFG
jgi:uncharacterized protein (DUF2141 family)